MAIRKFASNLPLWFNGWLGSTIGGIRAGSKTAASPAILAAFYYSLLLCGVLAAMDMGE